MLLFFWIKSCPESKAEGVNINGRGFNVRVKKGSNARVKIINNRNSR